MKPCQCKESCLAPLGKCHCGCGATTNISKVTNPKVGTVKGQHVRYLRGHAAGTRGNLHALTDIDLKNKLATCSRCGRVTIKKWDNIWRCTGKQSRAHTITDPNEETRRGWCRACKGEVDIHAKKRGSGHVWECKSTKDRQVNSPARKAYMAEYNKAYHARTGGISQRKQILKQYNLTPEQYEAILEAQGGKCALCLKPPPEGRRLAVDHCHVTLKNRGLLCTKCNRGLGLLGDDIDILRRAVAYLS